jgi:hypothetical protein
MNSGFVSLEGRPNSWFCAKSELRGAGKEIQTVGSKPWENRWIRTFMGYRVSEVQGLKEFLFDCRSHEVPSAEGSYEHVAHPIGGAAWLTGGVTTRVPREKWKRVTGGGHTSPGKESTHC